jgi:hypothetical protein
MRLAGGSEPRGSLFGLLVASLGCWPFAKLEVGEPVSESKRIAQMEERIHSTQCCAVLCLIGVPYAGAGPDGLRPRRSV